MAKSNQDVFWKNFARKNWEKKPILVKNFNSSLCSIDAEQIFLMLVEYSNYCRKIKKTDGFKLYIRGQIQHPEDVLQILPLKNDKTLLGYHKRMEKLFEDYCLVCDELLQVSQKNLKKLYEFSDQLFSYVGFPNRFAEIGLYLGNYRQTPFGVHVDGCGVFSFPVVGEKNFRLWEPSFAELNPKLDRAHEYSRYKKNSKVFVAEVGDMTYWPSSAWHIAESKGSFSATWSIGVWVDQTYLQSVEMALNPLLKEKLVANGSQTMVQRLPQQINQGVVLPQNYLNTVSILKNITQDEWYDTLLKSWLKLNSKNGFKNESQKKSLQKLSMKSKIQQSHQQHILWSHLKSEAKTIYAFQGIMAEGFLSESVVQLIQALNSNCVCLISDYLKNKNKARDLKTLEILFQAGAFERI